MCRRIVRCCPNFSSDNSAYDVYINSNGEAMLAKPFFTIAYNENGAEGGALPTNKVSSHDPGALSETGWAFNGWFHDPDGVQPWNFDIDTITGDTTIYASWSEKEYAVRFDPNGGTGAIVPIMVNYTGNITIPGGDAVSMKDNLYRLANNGAVTLYALWTANDYVISYELDGGALDNGKQNPTSYNAEDLPLTISYPPKKNSIAGRPRMSRSKTDASTCRTRMLCSPAHGWRSMWNTRSNTINRISMTMITRW